MTGDLLVVKTILQIALHSCLPPFLPHRLAFGGWRGHLTGAAEDTVVFGYLMVNDLFNSGNHCCLERSLSCDLS